MSVMLEQKRAKYALDKVLKEKKDKEKYGTFIRRLPPMILTNGLGQALAFLLADAEGKEEKPSWRIYSQMQQWLIIEQKIYAKPDSGLIETIVRGSRSDYMHAQQEALSLLVWMKKFADAYLPESGGKGNG